MPDPRFFLTNAPLSVSDALKIGGAELLAGLEPEARLSRVADIGEAGLVEAVVYIDVAGKASQLSGKRFGLCFAPRGAPPFGEGAIAAAGDPRSSFAAVAAALHALRPLEDIAPSSIGEGARLHPTAIIGGGAKIGRGAVIGPYAVIGPGVVIGEDAVVAEHASVWCALVGARVRIGVSAAIGGPGFGFAAARDGLARIPQLGRVVIGDDVEIGAQTCVDRGMLADTVIGDAAKIDNLVQIGHNVRIGRGCILTSQVGIAGSVELGERVQCGGQAGIADHLTIGADARIAAKAGVISNIPAGETWGGYPARPMKTWLRAVAAERALSRKKKAIENGD